MQKNIQEFQQTVSQDLQKKSVDMMQPLIEKAKEAIDRVASNMGYDYVLDSSNGGSVIIAKGKDIMAEVKKELGF
jgi:outer membrane protein